MDLRQVSRSVQEQLAATAAVADEPTRRAAELLAVSLEPAVRLALQEAIGQVASQVSAEIAPGRVDLSLRGGEIEVHVVPPAASAADGPPVPPAPDAPPAPGTPPAPGAPPAHQAPPAAEEPEAGSSRVSFRPPQHLKSRLEQAADAEGLSMNAYLVRALTAHLDAPHGPDPSAHTHTHTHSYTRHGAGRTSGWYI